MAAIGTYDKDAAPTMIIPKGEYVGQVSESDYKPTKKGDGHYIMLTWKIVDGPYKDRTLTDFINVDNPNKLCRDIGNAAFAAIRIALFNDKSKVVTDTAEMHGIPCKLGIDVDKEGTNNIVKKYTGMGVNTPAAGAASGGGAPWQKPTEDRF